MFVLVCFSVPLFIYLAANFGLLLCFFYFFGNSTFSYRNRAIIVVILIWSCVAIIVRHVLRNVHVVVFIYCIARMHFLLTAKCHLCDMSNPALAQGFARIIVHVYVFEYVSCVDFFSDFTGCSESLICPFNISRAGD